MTLYGKVKWFSDDKKFGFIEIEGQADVFVHLSALQHSDPPLSTLKEGARVEFDKVKNRKDNGKFQAENVRLVNGTPSER